MKQKETISLWIYGRPDVNVSVDTRHEGIVANMKDIGAPFGWRGLPLPLSPKRRKGDLLSSYRIKYPLKAVSHFATYQIRDIRYLEDIAGDDDKFAIEFPIDSDWLDFSVIAHEHFPEIISALGGYRAALYLKFYASEFSEKYAVQLAAIRATGVNVDGRNNIFTLNSAQYWDAELCQRALGYGPDEVIRRLDGQVPLVRSLMDGVYTVFNDDPDLSFEQFCAINDRFKPILGLA